MSTPVLPHHIYEGGDYWASWGSKGWTAVRVLNVKRKFADVERINPKTNKTKSRNAQVRLDEMVKRDPKQKGSDKPSEGPGVIFKQIRDDKADEAKARAEEELEEMTYKAPVVLRPCPLPEDFYRAEYIGRLVANGMDEDEAELNWEIDTEEW